MTEQQKKLNLKQIENGPLEDRQCRDVICCILFIVNVVAMFYCSIFGYVNGNINNIFRGTDQYSNICSSNLAYPYLYFYNPASLSTSARMCVTQCPSYVNSNLKSISGYNFTTSNYKYTISQDGSSISINNSVSYDLWGYQTTAFISRICVPTQLALKYLDNYALNNSKTTSSSGVSGYFYSSVGGSYLSNLISDIQNNWPVLLGAFGLAILISFILMFLLRWLAGLIVWISIIGTIAFLTGLGFIFYYSSGKVTNSTISYMGYSVPTVSVDITYLAYYAYAIWVIAGILAILLLCCCNRIRLAVAVCKCAGKFVVQVCSTIFVPIIMSLATVALWVVCAVAMIYLVSSATYIADGSVLTSIASYSDTNLIKFYYFVFGTLWCNALIQACTIFVIASACCMWYYSHGPGQDLHFPILRSYGRAVRYHLGSLAFGSLILAIVQFLQLMVQAFKNKQRHLDRKYIQYMINCLRCCLACVQRIVQFINKSAYIQIALSGKNFCMAAKDGFQLVWSNPLRYSVVGGIGEIIMFLGKIMIAAGTTGAVYAFIQYSKTYTFLSPLLILLLVFIYSYTIGVIFMVVYSLGMDTLLVCFIVDQISNKQKGGKGAQYAPEQLAQLMDSQ